MGLAEEIAAVREAAARHAAEGEELAGIVPTETGSGGRVYLCAYAAHDGEESAWLALDADGEPVAERAVVRDAVSVAALCELAEESAGGGDVAGLRARLAELRETENPEGIVEAEEAAAELEHTIVAPPRVASLAYLDAIGTAATRLEQTLGEVGGSPFAVAMKTGTAAAEDLALEVQRRYKAPLA